MRESKYQAGLIKRLRVRFPGCVILKNDPGYLQGVPDLIILFNKHWAMLEVKKSADAPARPNQPYYVHMLKSMSYAAFIYPSNESEILSELEQAFELGGTDPRVPGAEQACVAELRPGQADSSLPRRTSSTARNRDARPRRPVDKAGREAP